jgi:hypothetical protein
MEQQHINDVLKTGYLSACSMRKLISTEETTTATYTMQYTVDSEENYLAYQKYAAPLLQADVKHRFEGKFTAQRAFYKITFEA